eukprot:gene20476-22492_t
MDETDASNQDYVPLLSPDEHFEDAFDQGFWKLVHKRYKEKAESVKKKRTDGVVGTKSGRLWSKSLDEIRAERIKEKHSGSGKDAVVAMMKDWVRIFKEKTPNEELEKLLPNFQNQLARLASVLIDKECEANDCAKHEKHKCKYGGLNPYIFTDPEDGTKKTLLHIAAEENLYILTLELVNRFSGLLYVNTLSGRDIKRLPVELALQNDSDDVASSIIKKMRHERVRLLFEFDEMEKRCRFSFKNIINKPNMKKTVVAVLDSLVSPDWPYIPVEMPGEEESEWSTVPDVPIRYHFFYRILDGDDEGRPAYHKNFNYRSDSCFKLLLQSPHKETIMHHPVIRVLANSKWDNFGKIRIKFYAFLFVLYLLALSIGLLGAVNSKNPLLYKTSFDYFRGFCEGVTLLGAMVYLLLEIVQLSKERFYYFHDVHNFSDVCGVLLIFAVVPLRCFKLDSQWNVAAFAYLVNFFRMFKYFPAWKFVGLYSKVLAQMFLYDFTKFAVVYLFVMLSFAGSIFLALKAANGLGLVGNFGRVILLELRGLVEGKEFSDSYSKFSVIVVILLLVNMLMVTVMLVNMLIAQLSYRYEVAQERAELHYDINKCLIVAKLEQNPFKKFSLRLKHYKDGEFVIRKSDVNEILLAWDKMKEDLKAESLPGMEEKMAAISRSEKDQFHGFVMV